MIRASARGRNFGQLAATNALHCVDDHIVYDDDDHRYTVDGLVVPISVTAVLKKVVGEIPFQPDLIIKKNLAAWRRNPRSKYASVVAGHDDQSAAMEIKKRWLDANRLGIALHRRLEGHLNGEAMPLDGETDEEWPGLVAAIDELAEIGAIPFRTELSVFWRRASDNLVVCAGQVDVVMRIGEGDTAEFVMIDLKRTDKSLSASTPSFDGKLCHPPLETKTANDHTKYSLQLSMYSVMMRQCTGIIVPPKNRFLLRAHPSSERAELIECACLDAEAEEILNAL